jgi:hypothetical protein
MTESVAKQIALPWLFVAINILQTTIQQLSKYQTQNQQKPNQ